MHSGTILIVDDNADNRTIFSFFLENLGFTVLTAENGWEGVRQAREHRPGLILMDISMPVMDGLEATELLKVDPETKHIPVIAVTAHDSTEMRLRARSAGCDEFLSKPVQPGRILREVERFLSPAA